LRAKLKTLTLLLVVMFLTLLVGEVAVRVAYSDITTTADNAGYFTVRWNAENPTHRNRMGFREREVTDRVEGVYRIAVLGDSFTFGQGIPVEDRMTEQLAVRLGEGFEIWNFGTPGAELVDHLETLSHEVASIDPDFVLVQWFINDFWGRAKPAMPRYRRLVPFDGFSEWLRSRSALFYVMELGWKGMQMSFGWAPSNAEALDDLFLDEAGDAWLAARQDFDRLLEIARERSLPLGIVAFPDLVDVDGDTHAYPAGYLIDRLLVACEESAVSCLDLRPVFAPSTTADLIVNRFDRHPNARANEMATTAILAHFGTTWESELEP
jgi:hypothetical protein